MKLYIDTSSSENIKIKLDGKVFETDSRRDKAQALLPFIYETLKTNGALINEITKVNVNTGPGSFTGLRVGVAVANALAWSLKIPKQFIQINYSK